MAVGESKQISEVKSEDNQNKLEFQASVPVISLGAPVVDEKAEVIGVVTTANEADGTSSIVRPVSALKSLVAQVGSEETIRWPNEAPPTPTPRPRLVYTPKPVYPAEARYHDGISRSGRYRVNFDTNGTVKNIQVLRSTGSDILDRAATDGLQQWKCEPGREGYVVVPLTFKAGEEHAHAGSRSYRSGP